MKLQHCLKTILLSLALAGPAAAQGGPGGGGGGGGGPMGGGPVGAGPPAESATVRRERPQFRASEQDRLRVRGSLDAAAQVRSRARALRQAALGEGFGREQALQHRDQVRAELEALERRHAEFVAGLASPERDRIRDPLRDMDLIRERARDRLRELDAACEQDAPDRDRVRDRARELAREMTRLRDRYRDLGVD